MNPEKQTPRGQQMNPEKQTPRGQRMNPEKQTLRGQRMNPRRPRRRSEAAGQPLGQPLWVRILVYLAGVCFLALGITLTTQINLGVSPIISIAFGLSEIFNANFGDMAFLVYGAFTLIQVLLHWWSGERGRILPDLAQFIVNLILTRFYNLFGRLMLLLATGPLQPLFGSLIGRLVLLVFAIFSTGVGAAMSLNMRLIPNPGDGIVQSLADFVQQPLGSVKNFFDIGCVVSTCALTLRLRGRLVGIGLGTVLAMIGVGRSIAFYQWATKDVPFLREQPQRWGNE